MKAYKLAGWKQGGHYVDVAKPEAGAGDVLIRMDGAGICHSDLHIMHEWTPEIMPYLANMEPDFTLGHENAGWIEAIGPGVRGWEVDQAVVISPVWACGRCAACRAGDDAYCEDSMGVSGGLGLDGGLASHMVAPARSLVALKNLEPSQAAPLTDAGMTSYHAVKHSLDVLTPDSTALVIGVGGLGHMAVAYLRELTGGPVIAVDRSDAARQMATDLGADLVLDSDETTAEAVKEATGGLGVRAVFDFVGIDATMKLAATVVRKRGKVTVVGLGGGIFPFTHGSLPYATTIGYTFGGSLIDLAEVVALAESGRVRPHVQHFAFDQIGQAYQALHEGKVKGRAVILP
ncbi:MAG: NAD(P)-dependent alcohol dehydrogenase [Pseudomonadota bacterium]|nr:NAD(P)-dependent alcohol dehydrogenase [Pseudomonadota bacterium]